jgi:hypothetical protein
MTGSPVGQNAGSRSIGQVMQWPPPRPLPSSNPATVITSMPAFAQRGVRAGVPLEAEPAADLP